MSSDEKDKKEESQGTIIKIVAAVFGTVLAPILVAAGIKFSDSLFSSPAPANPDAGKAAAEAKQEAVAAKPAGAAHGATSASERSTTELPYTRLFNGRDLSGWSVAGNYLDRWSVNSSSQVLVGTAEPGNKNRNWLFTDDEFTDFRLRFEFRLGSDTESGFAVRTPHTFNVKDGRIAISLANNSSATSPTGSLVTWSGGVAHVQAAPKMTARLRPDDQWNNVELEFRGSHLILVINGDTLLDVRVDELHGKGTGGLQRSSGRIALDCKAGRVRFRNIEAQRLK